MAYGIGTFVEDDDYSGTPTTTYSSPNFTPGAASALVAFVWYYYGSGAASITLSDTVGGNDTWTEVGSGLYSSGNGMRAFVLLNASASSTTIQASFGASTVIYPSIAIVEVTGIQTSSAEAGNAMQTQAAPGTSTDAVTSGNTGTLTGQPAAIIAGTQNTQTDSTPAVGTGYTNIGTGWNYGGGTPGARFEHKRVTATTAVAGTFTAGSNVEHQTIAVALLESGGGPSNAPRAVRHLANMMGA